MVKTKKDRPRMQFVLCDKCNDSYYLRSDISKEERRKLGWVRKWSWRKFRFLWLCPPCAPRASLP